VGQVSIPLPPNPSRSPSTTSFSVLCSSSGGWGDLFLFLRVFGGEGLVYRLFFCLQRALVVVLVRVCLVSHRSFLAFF